MREQFTIQIIYIQLLIIWLLSILQKEWIMLITFTCKAHKNITMFGDVALRLIQLMGHSGTIPSAIAAADIPTALHRLQAAIQAQRSGPNMVEEDENSDVVSLRQRAFPLIGLLEDAVRANASVTWDSTQR